MTFLWPEMLWLLLATPLLVAFYFWLLQRRKKNAIRFGQNLVSPTPNWTQQKRNCVS